MDKILRDELEARAMAHMRRLNPVWTVEEAAKFVESRSNVWLRVYVAEPVVIPCSAQQKVVR